MRLYRPISTPIRDRLSWDEKWKGPDNGLIASWERGRERTIETPELAAEAKNGRLVPMGWKGGVERPVKGKKVGTLWYLAAWQGLRGEDLDLDVTEEYTLTCTVTGVTVVYTGNYDKYKNASEVSSG